MQYSASLIIQVVFGICCQSGTTTDKFTSSLNGGDGFGYMTLVWFYGLILSLDITRITRRVSEIEGDSVPWVGSHVIAAMPSFLCRNHTRRWKGESTC
nr:hypothetical protein [Tanacetum cinerariifolium]